MTLLTNCQNRHTANSFSNFDSVLNSFLKPMHTWTNDAPGFLTPSVDIHETDDAYVVQADLPGIKKEDIDVSLEDGVLTISAKRNSEAKEEKEGVIIRQERRIGQYLRRFDLGQSIDKSDIIGKFNNGVLTLTVSKQKTQQAENQRIEIE